MPDDNFEPRIADQRIGYFSEKVTDLSTYDTYPARDLMNKWRLIKKILMLIFLSQCSH